MKYWLLLMLNALEDDDNEDDEIVSLENSLGMNSALIHDSGNYWLCEY